MATIALILATTALTWALLDSNGPFGVFYKLRQRIDMLECFLCTSFWVSIALWLVLSAYSGTYSLELLFISFGGANVSNRLIQAYEAK